MDLFSADPSSDTWKTYVDYLDDMLLDGLFLAIECSLKYLLENTGISWLRDVGCYWDDNRISTCGVTVKCN